MKRLISVELIEEDGVQKVTWNAPSGDIQALDQLIAALGQLRADSTPPVRQEDPKAGENIGEAIQDPRWFLGLGEKSETLLAIRHPGFGWLTFQLPDESKNRLRRLLQ